MDIFAHALWTGVGMTLAYRRRPIAPRTVALTVGLAALPDLLHLMPIFVWWMAGDRVFAILYAYAVAVPGQEPQLPPLVNLWSHHLHCITHSAVVAAVLTLLVWVATRSLWIPLLGWWSHIVIDLFTHSADFYPVQVLYPLSDYSFDGLPWNTPWLILLNYVLLCGAILWLLTTRTSHVPGPHTNLKK